MLYIEGRILFEPLQKIDARNPKWQKTHHATRSSGIEEHGYRNSEEFAFEDGRGAVGCRIQVDLGHPVAATGSGQSAGNIFSGTQFRTIGPSVDLHYPV